jgi:hypothetical protein
MKRTVQKIVLVCAVCVAALYTFNMQMGAGAATTGDTTTTFYGVPGITCGANGCLPGPPGGGFFTKPFDPITNPQGSQRQFMQTDFVWAIPFFAQ